MLDPPETLSQRAFHFALCCIYFIASNSLLPLQLRITKAPTFWWFSSYPFALLHLHLLTTATYLVYITRRTIISTVTPQILHACWGHLASTVAFNLEPFISAWFGSELHHHANHNALKSSKKEQVQIKGFLALLFCSCVLAIVYCFCYFILDCIIVLIFLHYSSYIFFLQKIVILNWKLFV